MKKKIKTATATAMHIPVAISFILLIILCSLRMSLADQLKVVYAVNAGGSDHTDRNGIHFEADPLLVGISSDYGKHMLMIGRVHEHDEVLYRTERYHTSTFGYDFPADGDGDYALIMKFCEVYFDAPNRKVFDVVLNRKHTVVRQLDIYNEVGRGTAHDEIVYFKISNGRLIYKSESSEVRNGVLRLDFIKGALDNPKINAFALLKGDVSKLPRLPKVENKEPTANHEENSIEMDEDELDEPSESQQQRQKQQERVVRYNERELDHDNFEDDDEEEDLPEELERAKQSSQPSHKAKLSGPRQPNPYTMDDSSILLPVFIAIGAFIPMLFCLCKL